MSTEDSEAIMNYDDLERRWKPKGPTAKAKRKWIIRRCRQFGIVPIDGAWRNGLFRRVSVVRAEERREARAAVYA